jgi:ribose transport system permease protein
MTLEEHRFGPRGSEGVRRILSLSGFIEVRMTMITVVLIASLSLLSPHFMTLNNVLNLMDQSVVVGMVALGQTFVILIRGIDLSVGSLVGVTGVIFGLALSHTGIPGSVAACLLAGMIFGLVNGLVIVGGRIAPFVVTLGMMSIARSLAYVFSDAHSINTIPDALGALTEETLLGFPINFVFLVFVYCLGWWFLNYCKGGRTIYAIGSNPEAARVSGLSIEFWSVFAYLLSGLMCAIAAVFLAARIFSIDPIGGTGLELDAIAAVVIGGASLFGGRGSLFGTLAGVIIMVLIRNALNLLGISPYWQGAAIGLVIILAVLIEGLVSRRSARQ